MHIPKIQEMLDKIPTPSSGAVCNERTGWLPSNFDDNCREILNETVSALIRTSDDEDDEDLDNLSFARDESLLEEEDDDESMYENDVS